MKKTSKKQPDLEREREELLASMRSSIPQKLRNKIEHVVKVSQSSRQPPKIKTMTHGAGDADAE